MSNYPKVLLTEEGMRDGLQIERPDIPVADKIRLLDAIIGNGLERNRRRFLRKSQMGAANGLHRRAGERIPSQARSYVYGHRAQ